MLLSTFRGLKNTNGSLDVAEELACIAQLVRGTEPTPRLQVPCQVPVLSLHLPEASKPSAQGKKGSAALPL